jgi:uncharacterized RDD family membrane protein YckC
MERDVYEVHTADNVGIGYDIAGLGSRVLAMLVDLVSVSLLVLALSLLVLGVFAPDNPAFAVLIALSCGFLAFVAYFVVAETAMGGRTPGKQALGIRVVRLDGGAPGFTEALIRGVLRIADLAAGWLLMFFHPLSRRIGDIAAGTVVVRERRALSAVPAPVPVLLRTPDAGPGIDGAAALGDVEYAALRAFLSRAGLDAQQRARLAAQIATRLLDRLGLPPSAPERSWPPELFLERLYLQLAARLGSGPAG